MEVQIISYTHHGGRVFVRKDLKGRHRAHCLCYNCDLFHPEDDAIQCVIADDIYSNCVTHNIVTPVWECPDYRLARPGVIERRLEIQEMAERDDDDDC